MTPLVAGLANGRGRIFENHNLLFGEIPPLLARRNFLMSEEAGKLGKELATVI